MTNEDKILDILAMMQSAMATRQDVAGIVMKIENTIEPKLELLAEGHSAILDKIVPRTRVDELEDRVSFPESVVRQMSEELRQLRKAQ